MSDINRIFIFLILTGLLFALYKYQDVILENFDSLQLSMPTMNSLPSPGPPEQPLSLPSIPQNKESNKITADNISQISILSAKNFDNNSLLNSDNLSNILDDNTYDTHMSKQTCGSLFD